MPYPESKKILFGLMAGAAGITLGLIWYRKTQKCSKAMYLPTFLNSEGSFDLVNFPHETHNEQGTVMLLQGRQLQVLEKMNGLIATVEELKREVAFLKEAIPKLEELVRDELKGRTDSRRSSPLHRGTKKRKTEIGKGVSDTNSSEEAESEGGYITAHTDTEGESEEEKGWISSSTSPLAPEEKIELFNLLQNADRLHYGSDNEKRESFKLLLENEEKYRNHTGFLWRLARAYGDMFAITTEAEEKKDYATKGKLVSENAVNLDPSSAESHQWFAMMCGYMSQFESVQNKIRNGYLFKEHLDKAIELKPQDPFLYYLTGRWCYEAEELQPGYSKHNYVYLAKCYKDLGQRTNALKFCDTASSILSVTKDLVPHFGFLPVTLWVKTRSSDLGARGISLNLCKLKHSLVKLVIPWIKLI
uniref:Regulator of microtubule dynamics protein 2 n=1 Tax=Podarcis muralis TaxID=64176 RepID=A0A670HN17_PODMU